MNKRRYLKILIFVFCLIVNIKVNATNATVEVQRQAVLQTAEAYFRQKSQLQYDSYRKNLYITPEDGTSQHYTYTVCSGFTFSVYYQSLGIKIPDTTEGLLTAAKNNKESANVIEYYEGEESINSVLGTKKDDETQIKATAVEWASKLLPGDIIVVTGHAMLVHSIDSSKLTTEKPEEAVMLIESGASAGEGRYNYDLHQDRYAPNGTIKKVKLISRLREYNGYIGTENAVEQIAIIRVVTEDKKYINSKNSIDTYEDLTPAAKTRLQYPEIDIEKTFVNLKSKSPIFVDLGDELTYTISITNGSQSNYTNINVKENLDSNLVLVNANGGSLKGSELTWNIPSIAPGETKKITYVVKVKNKVSNKIIISTGSVGGISSSKIELLVGNRLSDEQINQIKKVFNNLKGNSQIERDFINQIYLNSLKLDMELKNLSNLDIIGYASDIPSGGKDTLSIKTTSIKKLEKYIYHNFYGLRIAEKDNADKNLVRAILQWNIYSQIELNDRARIITEDMLIDGDIILLYNGKTSSTDETLIDKSYIYLDNSLNRKIGVNNIEEITGDDLTVFLRDIVGENYIILRPSLSLNVAHNNVVEKNPATGINSNTIILTIGAFISLIIYIIIRKKSKFINHI